jgi:glutamyl-tRNA reductase
MQKANDLAAALGGRAVPLERLREALAAADIVISGTGASGLVIHHEDVEAARAARRARPLFLIDIAVPRDIDPEVHALENVYLYNIDGLQNIVCENARLREQELSTCRAIVEAKTAELIAKLTPEKSYEGRVLSEPVWTFSRPVAACG